MHYGTDRWIVRGKDIGWRTTGTTNGVLQFYRGFRNKGPFGPVRGDMHDCDCFQAASEFAFELAGGFYNWMKQDKEAKDG